jgi:hypothetical protein
MKSQHNSSFPVLNSDSATARTSHLFIARAGQFHIATQKIVVEEFRQESVSERTDICSRSSRSDSIDELAKSNNELTIDLTGV